MAETVTLARPYAKAVFSAAVEDKALSSWSKALSVLSQVLESETVGQLIDAPNLTAADKSAAVIDICGDELDSKQVNLVKVLADNDRLSLLGDVSALFEAYRAAHEKTVDVNVETAFELSPAQLESLQAGLKKTLEREVSVSSRVNENLLGGVFIRAGDTVIDASLRGRLDKLAAAIGA